MDDNNQATEAEASGEKSPAEDESTRDLDFILDIILYRSRGNQSHLFMIAHAKFINIVTRIFILHHDFLIDKPIEILGALSVDLRIINI